MPQEGEGAGPPWICGHCGSPNKLSYHRCEQCNKLKPEEFQGGTASISNMGMFGIKQFEAVINPPQGMIMAIGAGEKRPYIVNGELAVATVMSATGSFDHRAIDGADGAELMKVFKDLVERPLGMLA